MSDRIPVGFTIHILSCLILVHLVTISVNLLGRVHNVCLVTWGKKKKYGWNG